MKPVDATPIPWPPFGIAPIDATFEPAVVMFKPTAGEHDEVIGSWPLRSVTAEIVIQALRWQKLNPKMTPLNPSPADRDELFEVREQIFRAGEVLGEVGTTRHVNEQIAYGLWVIDQLYRQTAALRTVFPILGNWPARADLWRGLNRSWAADTTPWIRNEDKRAERIKRFDNRLKPEAKAGLVASALKHAIDALK